MPVTRIEKFACRTVGEQTRQVIEVKRRLELDMSDDHADGEGSGGHEVDLVDVTEDMEIELNLPGEVEVQDRPREDIRKPPGAVSPGEAAPGDIYSSPRTGPDLNGPGTACRSRVFWNQRHGITRPRWTVAEGRVTV